MKTSKDNFENKFETIERWKQSGKSISQFCKDENLPYHKFHYWRRKYIKTNNPIGFIKIKKNLREPLVGNYCELYFASGTRLVFNQKPEAGYIKELL